MQLRNILRSQVGSKIKLCTGTDARLDFMEDKAVSIAKTNATLLFSEGPFEDVKLRLVDVSVRNLQWRQVNRIV